MDFKDTVSIITGARSGIGFATAKQIGSAGGHVALVGRTSAIKDSALTLKKMNIYAKAYIGDVADELFVQELIIQVERDFGPIDFLVNNAGTAGLGAIESVSLEDWNDTFRNNATSAFVCSKAVVPGFKSRMRGKIVNVSSVAGRSFSMSAGVHYTAAKTAMIGLTRQLARELAKYNIHVNCVAPAQTKTEMLEGALKETGATLSELESKIPLGRAASPDEIADVIVFMLSKKSSFMTGSIVDVNGGLYS